MIAIDVPMPDNCCDCPCCADLGYDVVCLAYGGHLLSGEPFEKRRMPFCPLIDLSRYEDDAK